VLVQKKKKKGIRKIKKKKTKKKKCKKDPGNSPHEMHCRRTAGAANVDVELEPA